MAARSPLLAGSSRTETTRKTERTNHNQGEFRMEFIAYKSPPFQRPFSAISTPIQRPFSTAGFGFRFFKEIFLFYFSPPVQHLFNTDTAPIGDRGVFKIQREKLTTYPVGIGMTRCAHSLLHSFHFMPSPLASRRHISSGASHAKSQ